MQRAAASPAPRARADRAFCHGTARLAVRCLHAELTLHPKPGLVSLLDNGSHDDMTAVTFMRSLFALRHYFARICQAGIDGAPFAALKRLGIDAELRMLRVTGGVNTHRGAIFSLGLLCAAIGQARARRTDLSAAALRAILLTRWGDELAAHMHAAAPCRQGPRPAGGAREEGALGLPSVFEVGLPALHNTLGAGRGMRHACIDALFALMAHISDSNVFHRGGSDGAQTVKQQARRFLALGGTAHPQWQEEALSCHRLFVGRRLSPGGAADLLAATCLVHAAVARGLA
ncbi:triphosphoribosyl-dephospho-CoA synthase [Janthinobacterium fluminis]|uniref:triphosphoribosyl-dephospho-CoA synthase n=1 Tax=Janthinobacterium fluminis TaxID=2987524 RepID=A0ABT5JUL8_9BURK|nr:triphosphoribosyl-dephospho-CoA synthase [Janthinobacterium fluminis]MDC8756334.1 triphosphoribosyl-dephospho-CoA synthase [Janthinobacterium fluminis]